MPPTTVLDKKQKKIVETCAGRLTAEQVADLLGISRRTFFEILKRDEEVAALYKKGRADTINKVSKTLIDKALDGETACVIFYLKTQAGWREVKEDDKGTADLAEVMKEIAKRLPV